MALNIWHYLTDKFRIRCAPEPKKQIYLPLFFFNGCFILPISIPVDHAWRGKGNCLNCSLRSQALFSGLIEEDFKQLHQPIDQMVMQPGDVLYRKNDTGRFLFTVRSGLIKLVKYLPDGRQRIVRLVCSAEVMGMELLAEESYRHEAIALQQTELCRYPVDEIDRLSLHNPVLHRALMEEWEKMLSEAEAWLTQLSTGPAKRRMASLLLRLTDDITSECYLFSREDIGSILSITTETASRTISEFKRQGLIKALGHNHYYVDTVALKAIP